MRIDMTKLEQIEQAIASLNKADQAKRESWWEDYRERNWDRQIEDDVKAGKFDAIAEEVLADHRSGRTRLP